MPDRLSLGEISCAASGCASIRECRAGETANAFRFWKPAIHRGARLYTVDLGTRRKCATSETVRISPSEGNTLSRFVLVAVAIVSFITDMVSVCAVSNFSCRFYTMGLNRHHEVRPLGEKNSGL